MDMIHFLDDNKATYKLMEHAEVRTCKEQAKECGCDEKQIAKSMLFKSDDGQFILAVGPGDRSMNRQKLEKLLDMKLSLASLDEVRKVTGAEPGAVPPFGFTGGKLVYDRQLLKQKSICFSASLTKTIQMDAEELVGLAVPEIVDFEEKKEQKKNTLGLSVGKEENTSEWYTQVIQKAELADYTRISGCIVFRPYSYAIWEKIHDFLDARFRASGVKNAYFPIFIPESLLTKEKEHVAGFSPEVAWVTHGGDTKLTEKLAVRPTSETIMYDSYSKWIRSHNDLPLRLNQWCNAVRWEFKYAVPFLRTREFLWQEGHTVFSTKEEADAEVREMLGYYAECYEELLAVPVIKGTKTMKEKFAGADYTTTVEIMLPQGKALQGGTSHMLGQNFAKSFGISFLDKDGQKKHPYQNSWGYSTRSIGAMILMHGDDKGLIMPPRAAPIQAVIVPIIFENTRDAVLAKAREIRDSLHGISIKLDDRLDYSSGWKFNEWELKGVPLRIEIGPKDMEKGQVMIVRRDTGEKVPVPFASLSKEIPALLEAIQQNLLEKAKKMRDESIVKADTWEQFAAAEKKLIFAQHCGDGACEEEIKAETVGVKALCIPFDAPKAEGKCVKCGKAAKYWAYWAKSY